MANNTGKNRFSEFGDRDQVVSWHASDDSFGRGLKWTTDLALGLVGFGTALASAAFAFVMINANIKTPTFGGSEYLLLFTRPLQHVKEHQFASRSMNPREIDMTPTGTITKPKYGDNNPMGFGGMPAPEPDVQLKSYNLQTVRGGVAILKGPRGEFPVESGSILPNGDRVISIDRRNGHWVVVTTAGVISDQKTN